MGPRYEVHADRNLAEFDGIKIYVVLRDPEKRKVVKVFEPIEEKMADPPTEYYGFPSFSIPEEVAQRLANQLWDAGVRPFAARGSAGQLEAVNGHLQDMRKIVSSKLKVDL